MRGPRLWVVALGAAIGVAGVAGSYAGYVATRTQGQSYAATFDQNMIQSQPALASIVLGDPTLRDLMLTRTQLAYEQGGWDQASTAFFQVVRSELTVYASDAAILACVQAWREVRRSLLSRLELCRAYGLGLSHTPGYAEATRPAAAACERAAIDGGRRRLTTLQPETMTSARYDILYNRARLGPAPLTGSEADALADPNASLNCQATIKLDDNLAALPPQTRALMVRTNYRAEQNTAVLPKAATARNDPPSDLKCPLAGTQFTLSMQANGIPVQWQVRGQQGWNCNYFSSVSGDRVLWGTIDVNPLKLLWPIEIGKSTRYPGKNAAGLSVIRTISVSAKAEYWLAWGRVEAFTIDEEVEAADNHYVISHYWSPALGFLIGEGSRVIKGVLPSSVAPDWQLVAVEASPPPAAEY